MSIGKEGTFLTRTVDNGQVVRMPIGRVSGIGKAHKITVFGGQHGTEYAGIEAVMRLYRDVNPNDVDGEIAIGLVTHEESFNNWTQFAATTPEIKSMMLELAEGSDYIINCHGGEFSEGMYPYVICRLIGEEEADQKALRMAEAFAFPLVSISRYRGDPPPSTDGTRPPWWLWPKKSIGDELGIPEITPEFGEGGSRDEGPMYTGIMNVLKVLGFHPGEPELPETTPKIIGDRFWLTAEEQGVFFPVVHVGDDVIKGQVLGVVRDYFGNIIQVVSAPEAGKVINTNIAMPVKKDGFLLWIGQIDG